MQETTIPFMVGTSTLGNASATAEPPSQEIMPAQLKPSTACHYSTRILFMTK